jgi:hypothetical protein
VPLRQIFLSFFVFFDLLCGNSVPLELSNEAKLITMIRNPYNVSKCNRHNEASGFHNDRLLLSGAGTVAAAVHHNNRSSQLSIASIGIQSQTRKKTTQKKNRPKHELKANQRRATVQLAVFSSKRAFDPTKDCEVCVPRYLNWQGCCVSVPHHAHHRICSINKETKGHSERFVEEENIAKEIMAQNKPKFTSVELHSQGTTAKAKEQFFSTRQRTGNENTNSSVETKNVVLPDAACL